MKDTRPVNLDMSTIKLPLTALVSITHRASGVFIFVGMAVLIWALDASLKSPDSFAALQALLASPLPKLIVWAVVSGCIYHLIVGVKHLLMDMGIGETMEGGMRGAKLSLVISLVLIILAGVWIW
ncbi:MAG: succinate dehydrogenase, cytochrome b556 subunit [Halieaceae bacterium]|nr:succinate dehydrogenase, cytochrome b556 subunit [Halieaceae bacterium]